jgi:hypothetical protein
VAETLLFVHGTGVRAAAYTSTLARIEQSVERHELALAVHGCYWGQAEGARLLCAGKSIPDYDATGGSPPDDGEQLLALWSLLYTDPWYELRLLRHMPVATPAFGKLPSAQLREMVEHFSPSDVLGRALIAAGIAQHFGSALEAIRAAPEFADAVETAPRDPLEHRRAIARAIVAHVLVASDDQCSPPPDGATRDAIVQQLTDEMGGYGLGVGEFLKGLVLTKVTKKLIHDRGELSDAAAPTAGDILRFLAHGDGVRRLITRAIADLEGQRVHLLGHSLGGIMCVDLLARGAIASVAGLVTVGSQAPFLYEIGALPGLMHPAALPDHFPRWTNIYDRRDILSYVAAGVLGDRVTDVPVDNGQPFPQSHGAYWSNREVWDAVAAAVG